jgi:hypothetical protein
MSMEEEFWERRDCVIGMMRRCEEELLSFVYSNLSPIKEPLYTLT